MNGLPVAVSTHLRTAECRPSAAPLRPTAAAVTLRSSTSAVPLRPSSMSSPKASTGSRS